MLARDGREAEVVNRDSHYSPHFQVGTPAPPSLPRQARLSSDTPIPRSPSCPNGLLAGGLTCHPGVPQKVVGRREAGGHWACRTLRSCLVLAPPHPLLCPPQEIRMLRKVVSVHPVSARFGAGDRGRGRAGRMGRQRPWEAFQNQV